MIFSSVWEHRPCWTSYPSPYRLAYGIQHSTASWCHLFILSYWWYPSYSVPAWQISYDQPACSSNVDARTTSYAQLPSWSGILSSGTVIHQKHFPLKFAPGVWKEETRYWLEWIGSLTTEAGSLRAVMGDLQVDSGYKDTFIGHMSSFWWNKSDFQIIQCDFL